MTTLPQTMSKPGSVVWWILSSALAWSLVPLLLFGQTMRTYLDVARALPVYLAVGLLMGTICGLGQMRLWPASLARRWLWACVIGYGLALPTGLFVDTLIPSMTLWGFSGSAFGFLPLTEPSGVTFSPMPASAIFGAFVIGLCQWPVVKAWLGRTRPAMAGLWVFGQWAVVGLGLFEAGMAVSAVFGSARQGWLLPALRDAAWGAVWGATAGVMIASVLWVLRYEASRPRE